MAQFQNNFVQDLQQDIKIRQCGTIVFNADNLSNVVSVELYNGEEAYSGGGTVVGAVVCPDGATVALDGTLSGNKASITLTGDCFALPGQIGVSIQIVSGDVRTTVLKAIYNVDVSSTDTIVDPDSRITLSLAEIEAKLDEIPTILANAQTAIDGIEAQKDTMIASIASVAEQGTDTTLTQSGVAADAKATGDQVRDLKSAIGADMVTMSPSWVQGKYIGAEGNVGTSSSFYATEYMPVSPNSYITFYSAIAAIAGVAFYDKNKYFVSYYTDDELYKQRTLKVPENAYYIRYSCRADYHDSASRQEQIGTVYLTEQIMAVWESMPDMAGYPVDMAKKADAVISWDAVAATAINGITSMANTVLTGNGYGASCNVNEGELYRISGRQFSSSPTNSSVAVYPAYLFINNGNVVHVGWIAEAGYFTNLEILIPSGVTQLIVNLNSSAGLTNAIKKANIINLGNINSQLIQTVQNTAHLDSVMNDMIFPVMTSTSWNTDRIVKLPLNIQSGQTVNFLISDYQATGNKNVSIAFGFEANNGGPYYQQENNKYAGLHRITATQDYDCAYVWIADATVTAICASVWVDGTVSMPRTFSILGDSYSTFSGYNPDGNITWYPSDAVESNNNCTTVENTWWFQFARDAKCALQLNESYSGSPICNDGYGTGGSDASTTSFIARMNKLPQSEMILVLGGLNDQWAEAQLGEYVYSDWTDAQKSQFRPALAYLFDWLLHYHVGAKIVFVKTDILNSDFSTSIDIVCAHYGIPVVSLTNAVDKTANHPNIAGMREITAQVIYTLVH